ncbi:MAG: tetratricopeptide repeat protein [Ramlibacter sp.]
MARAARALDPGRELREARAALDDTPTAQNHMRLAAALLEAGHAEEAVTQYQACLRGPFAGDPEIRFGAARALLAAGQPAAAAGHLTAIRASHPDHRGEQLALLLAQALGAAGRTPEARSEYESAIQRFGSFEAKAEYLIWALACGERELAGRLQQEVQRATQRWNRHTRELNQALLARLEAAYALARGKG